MEKLFVPYKIAKQLKDKGFTEPCLAYYDINKKIDLINRNSNIPHDNKHYANLIACPIYQQVVDWFREKHNMIIMVYPLEDDGTIEDRAFADVVFVYNKENQEYKSEGFSNYYEALNRAIQKALELI